MGLWGDVGYRVMWVWGCEVMGPYGGTTGTLWGHYGFIWGLQGVVKGMLWGPYGDPMALCGDSVGTLWGHYGNGDIMGTP